MVSPVAVALSSPPSPVHDPSQPLPATSSLPLTNRALWLLPLLVLALDQITKLLIRSFLAIHDSVSIVGTWIHLTHIRNPGGAFGVRWGHDAVYYLSAVAVIVWILWQLRRHGATRRLSIWALALILGGALGNLIDRIALGEVVDFIDVEFFDLRVPAFDFGFLRHPGYLLDRWPTFNVADSAVTVGIAALIWSLWHDPVIGRTASAETSLDSQPNSERPETLAAEEDQTRDGL